MLKKRKQYSSSRYFHVRLQTPDTETMKTQFIAHKKKANIERERKNLNF